MNKGRLVLGFGLIFLSIVIFYISSVSNWNLIVFDNDIEDETSITTTDSVTGIHSIKADGVVTVRISTSEDETVRYVFNDKRYRNKSTFENGVLNINFPSIKKGFRMFGSSGSGVKVYVNVKSLKHIRMNGVGSVKSTNLLHANAIHIINEGTGSMKLQIAATKIRGRNSGVGSLHFEGSADTATLSNQGVGSLNANKLIVQVLNAANDGVGSMNVHAEKEIELRNSGVGSLRYSGDAKVISSRSDGIGSISKR